MPTIPPATLPLSGTLGTSLNLSTGRKALGINVRGTDYLALQFEVTKGSATSVSLGIYETTAARFAASGVDFSKAMRIGSDGAAVPSVITFATAAFGATEKISVVIDTRAMDMLGLALSVQNVSGASISNITAVPYVDGSYEGRFQEAFTPNAA